MYTTRRSWSGTFCISSEICFYKINYSFIIYGQSAIEVFPKKKITVPLWWPSLEPLINIKVYRHFLLYTKFRKLNNFMHNVIAIFSCLCIAHKMIRKSHWYTFMNWVSSFGLPIDPRDYCWTRICLIDPTVIQSLQDYKRNNGFSCDMCVNSLYSSTLGHHILSFSVSGSKCK